jgi:signal transduction histidine kinase
MVSRPGGAAHRLPCQGLGVTRAKIWVVALSGSGEVLAADGAVASWVGAELAEISGVPAPIREAAREVVRAVRRGAGAARARVDVDELDATIDLVGVAAVGLHRMPTDVRALLNYATLALERQAHALDVELTVEADEDVPRALMLDPEKIAWAVSALVGNSMRYVRRGTRQKPGGTVAVRVSFDGSASELVVVVADDGPGIAPEVQARLFRRAPGAPHATGLALTVVRDIVAAHGGSMQLASSIDEIEHGTTVTVRIPTGG